MDAIIEEGIVQQKLPGAVVLVGRKGKVVWQKAYGARALEPAREPIVHRYDLRPRQPDESRCHSDKAS